MIWFDGQITDNAQIEATVAGALMGWGVFTTLAIRNGAPVFWEHHAARLRRDSLAARVECSFNAEQLNNGLLRLVATENIVDGLARITGLRRDDGRWNSQSGAHWSIMVQPAVAASRAPLQLEVSPFRMAARSPLAGVKTTSYLPYFIAWEDARARGFDEALLLTESGWICEGARASIFWASEGTLYTPSLDCGCLRGVGRAVVLEQFAVSQERYELSALWKADEAFVVSGAAGVRAIGSLCDGRQTREWNIIGSLTNEVKKFFKQEMENG